VSAVPSPTVTPADIAAAGDWYRQIMPRHMAGWFTDGAPDERRALQAVDEMTRRANRQVAQLTATVKRGNTAEFEAALGLMVKRLHIAATALARGGAGKIQMGDLADE
jgi:hypothetical protein